MTTPEVLEVALTVPDRALAERLAGQLVRERLAACVQVAGPISSVYRWEGAVETAEEWTLRVKTTRPRLDALAQRIIALHPYDTPEVLVFPVAGGHEAYLAWVRESVSPEPVEPDA